MIEKRVISPDFLARITAILFSKVSIKNVLAEADLFFRADRKDLIQFDGLTENQIAEYMIEDDHFRSAYSKEECRRYAKGLIDFVHQDAYRMKRPISSSRSSIHVFDLLFVALDEHLEFIGKVPECKYENLFSWRHLYREMGEEVLISAFHALWDHNRGKNPSERVGFDWDYVTPHNNKPLRTILKRGIADHHSHLWGSAPYFHISWINIMNHLGNSVYIRNLRKLPQDEWHNVEHPICHAEDLQMRAAWIRWYLCSRLTGKFQKEYTLLENVEKRADLQDLNRQLHRVRNCDDWYSLVLMREKLQNDIRVLAGIDKEQPDYALNLFPWKIREGKEDYWVLVGERWFYYQVFADFCKAPVSRTLSRQDFALFYSYLLIRNRIRRYLVPVNSRMGFDNFREHELRKWYFLGDKKSEEYLTRLAVNQVLLVPNMRELELRISPDPKGIKRLEEIISPNSPQEEKLLQNPPKNRCQTACNSKKNHYYVFHFIRTPDMREADSTTPDSLKKDEFLKVNPAFCRMYLLRAKVVQQAQEIIAFRKKYPYLAEKLRGIDAASTEIGCRSEVFARAYRLLHKFDIGYGGIDSDPKTLPPLRKTYHAGEDFLDLVDGLRAVDETVKFLELSWGDRLGHAVTLGVNVEEWYRSKHYQIVLPIQDFLDNLAWLHHHLLQMNYTEYPRLETWIRNKFEYWFRIVYRNSKREEQINAIMKKAEHFYRRNTDVLLDEDQGHYKCHHCHFDIDDYYRAWRLRGDDPSCYVYGYFRKPASWDDMDPQTAYRDSTAYPIDYMDRYIPEYSILHYLYQFDETVYKVGSREISVEIPLCYVQAVKAVQRELCRQIARLGISIETNPTSNLVISTFHRYEDHPLLAFYNRGLMVTPEENSACAQLNVSINTDNSGVFTTNLETEYALMVRALEDVKDAEGNQRFPTQDIYTWIDNIRVMGLEQSFNSEF